MNYATVYTALEKKYKKSVNNKTTSANLVSKEITP
jgi:hypothetical protein